MTLDLNKVINVYALLIWCRNIADQAHKRKTNSQCATLNKAWHFPTISAFWGNTETGAVN